MHSAHTGIYVTKFREAMFEQFARGMINFTEGMRYIGNLERTIKFLKHQRHLCAFHYGVLLHVLYIILYIRNALHSRIAFQPIIKKEDRNNPEYTIPS